MHDRDGTQSLAVRERASFESFAALPSNLHAIESVALFAQGHLTFAALTGPSGWGKSHLLYAVASALKCPKTGTLPILQATEWAAHGHRGDAQGALILDNAQDALAKARTRLHLRLALERRSRARRPTLVAFSGSTTQRIRAFLPHGREWTVAEIRAPLPSERECIVRQMAEAEGVTISEQVVRVISRHMGGDGRTLLGALRRLRLAGSEWQGDALSLQACGLLSCFFADSPTWDLAEQIWDAANAACPGEEPAARSMALYVARRVALLPEEQVASQFDVRPARVYTEARRHEAKLKTCAATAEATGAAIRLAVERVAAG